MMKSLLITNVRIVNEGGITESDLLLRGERIEEIGKNLSHDGKAEILDAGGKFLLPGMIDDQVHFREPGLTHKADIFSESRAAVAGGITSFIDMPNTIPPTLTGELLEEKFRLARGRSFANYSFMLGGSNDNLDELVRFDTAKAAGIKLFLGSSTGNLLVDDVTVLEEVFSRVNALIAVHCEDETTVRNNLEEYKRIYGDDIPVILHPRIRTAEACYLSSSDAVDLARKTGARLHVFHLSTAEEMQLFNNQKPLKDKRITAEVCVHHLLFDERDYHLKGKLIKWNPAIKEEKHRKALWQALLDDRIDVIATDHAPHTLEEKTRVYTSAPSGAPMVQHAMNVLLDFYLQGRISLEKIVEKTAHNPAILFRIAERGFIREGYFADFMLVDMHREWRVSKDNVLYKCKWSPLEGRRFGTMITDTFVNGVRIYSEGKFAEVSPPGMRLEFDRR